MDRDDSQDESAFPASDHQASGMSLRDYFAGQAALGFVAALKREDPEKYSASVVATLSYNLADALLVARKAGPHGR